MDEQNSTLMRMYPALAALAPDRRERLFGQLTWLQPAAGTLVFEEGAPCTGLPFVTGGTIRVSKPAANGREITLYRVERGGVCIVSASCLLGSRGYKVRGTAEADCSMALLPSREVDALLAVDTFRRLLFGAFSERMADLMQLLEEVAFRKLDQRLAAHLLERGPQLQVGHQKIADELGSVREIVTRLLNDFAARGLVSLGRERIDVLDAVALQGMAAGEPAAPSQKEPCRP